MEWVLLGLGLLLIMRGNVDKAVKHFKEVGGIWPLPGRYPITSPFGWRRHPITNEMQFHNGVDLAVPCYTPIYAPFDGVVRFYWSNRGGNNLLVDDGTLTFGFAHLYRVYKTSGRVRVGEKIALTGGGKGMPGSGVSTGCHLHFTVRYRGKLIDPASFMRKLGVVV